MRLAFIDDAGTSNISADPNIVVAGVIAHGDVQVRPVELRLHELRDNPDYPIDPAVIFHAADIYHGVRDFKREQFPRDFRMKLLNQIAEIPREYELPVVIAVIDRAEFGDIYPDQDPREQVKHALEMASMKCALDVECFMRAVAPSEQCILIHENNDLSRATIRDLHADMRDPARRGEFEFLPLHHIMEAPLFAHKSESALLQVSDVVAFSTARFLKGDELARPVCRKFVGNLFTGATSESMSVPVYRKELAMWRLRDS